MGFRVHQHRRSLVPIWNGLWWLWWPMLSRDRWGLGFPDICLTVEKKTPEKTSTRKTDSTGDQTLAHCAKGNDVISRPQRWSVREILPNPSNFHVKIKLSPLQAMKAHRGCGCKGPLIYSHSTRRGRVASPAIDLRYSRKAPVLIL